MFFLLRFINRGRPHYVRGQGGPLALSPQAASPLVLLTSRTLRCKPFVGLKPSAEAEGLSPEASQTRRRNLRERLLASAALPPFSPFPASRNHDPTRGPAVFRCRQGRLSLVTLPNKRTWPIRPHLGTSPKAKG